MSYIYEWFLSRTTITENDIKNSFSKDTFVKTRIDIILNAFSTCGLLSNIGQGKYVLSNIKSAEILKCIYINRDYLSPAQLDDSNTYTDYIGNLKNGSFDVIDIIDKNTLFAVYPNLSKYQNVKTRSTPGITEASNINVSNFYRPYITTIRTKPFLLLAGISGTGKSRIVKDMAFQTCPNVGDLRSDNVSPGNYCLVEVKPNWHDSTELLGYDSVISGGYIVTKFVKFLVKAMLNDDIPFFVCLDEMNLAPVEQYFAEFLSVLESRKKEGEEITSEALIDKIIQRF
jgi:hypothetical protein